ncbi:Zn-dependent protease with chaperone function [Halanaeroarchaeum sp. HSR-CO]|uniref:hypothetical protein n=1 Tax=Halanaeroarchaeum sp. HSR-CO TaxID=2866382 RepID=UPI00217E69C7|nr:hypothetical protein [Halanaeroarchaeum sp. HSR-CO]UWG48345.1 Zn-dependent protease with chaperone function [Halanaeroarchaeum sp. HSR-CO]
MTGRTFGTGWLADRLTRWYARLLDENGVVDETVYRTHGEEHRVYWVDADRWPMGGQYTPFGTVVLNADRLDDLSTEAVDYVFLHEIGHGQRSAISTVFVYAVRTVVTLAAVLGLPLLGRRWVRSVGRASSSAEAIRSSSRLSIRGLGLVAGVGFVSWLDEGAAEVFALSKLGVTSYRRRRREFIDGADVGVAFRSLRRLVYPPPRLVVAVAEYLNRKRAQ